MRRHADKLEKDKRCRCGGFLNVLCRDQDLVESAMIVDIGENCALAILQEVLDHRHWVTIWMRVAF